MTERQVDAFGRLISNPDALSHKDKVSAVSQLAAQLLAGSPDRKTSQWLGQKLLDWLHRGGRLEQHLGLSAAPGSHSTIHNISHRIRRDQALVRFANMVGNDRTARRILQNKNDCPLSALEALEALQVFGKVPTAHDAISRARRVFRIS